MENIETHYCELWKEAKNGADRERLWLTVQNLRRLKVQLDSYYADYLIDKENARIDEKIKK